MTLNYFDTIESENKRFNKKLVRRGVPDLMHEKIYDLTPKDSVVYFGKDALKKVRSQE